MKKKSIIALLLALCLVFCFTLTACGGNSDEPADVQEEAEEATEEVEEEVEEEIETLESIINSDSDLKEQIASGNGQEGLTIEVKGNEVIYTFDMTAISDLPPEQLKDPAMIEALDQSLDEGGVDQFTGLCATMEAQTGLEGVKMTIIYTCQGDVLLSRTYDVNGEVE